WIVTDSNRRRFTNFGTTRHNQSYVLAVGEPGPLGAPAAHGMFPGDQLEDQTVAIRGDVGNVTASSYGSVGLAQPVWAPGRAFDGDASTAWVPAAEVPLVGQWVTAELPRPASVDSVDVQLLTPSGHPDAVGSLRVTTEQGSVVTTVDPGRDTQHLSVPPGETSWIRITFQSVAPGTRRAGIREVSIAGFAADQRLEVPSQLAAEFSDTTQPMPVYVFSRVVTNPRTAEELDPETSMRRRFTVPHSGNVNADAKIAAMPGDAALKLLDATSSFEVTATSTFGSLPRYAPRNLVDRDPNTFWVSGTRDDGFTPDANPHLTMRWNGVRTVDRVVVKAARGYSSPTSLRITSDSEQRTVPLDAATGDTISFSALTSDHVDIELLGSTAASTAVDRVGLSALEFPSLQDLAPGPVDRTQVVHVDCSGGPVVDVAGVERRFSVDATLGDVIDLRAVDASPCDSRPVALSAGEQDLDTRTGSSPFAIAGIRLMDSSLSTGDEPSRVRDIEVAGWGNEVRAVRIGPGEASYLAINENANDGWKASLNGRALQPVTLDGWRQGYLVPAGESGLVELRYEPTGSYRAALIIGLVLVVLLLIGAVIGGRRSRNLPMVNEGTWPASARLGVPVALAFAIGGVYALAMMAGWIIVRRLQSAMAKIIGLLVVAASLAATLPTETAGGLLGASGSRGVSILVVAAVSGAAATLLLRDAPGTSRSTTRVPTVPSP
ncbi:MAG: arabinofuranan 3-O-arabinosyltransferase, partial [Ilumatobacteraceae bacterium]